MGCDDWNSRTAHREIAQGDIIDRRCRNRIGTSLLVFLGDMPCQPDLIPWIQRKILQGEDKIIHTVRPRCRRDILHHTSPSASARNSAAIFGSHRFIIGAVVGIQILMGFDEVGRDCPASCRENFVGKCDCVLVCGGRGDGVVSDFHPSQSAAGGVFYPKNDIDRLAGINSRRSCRIGAGGSPEGTIARSTRAEAIEGGSTPRRPHRNSGNRASCGRHHLSGRYLTQSEIRVPTQQGAVICPGPRTTRGKRIKVLHIGSSHSHLPRSRIFRNDFNLGKETRTQSTELDKKYWKKTNPKGLTIAEEPFHDEYDKWNSVVIN